MMLQHMQLRECVDLNFILCKRWTADSDVIDEVSPLVSMETMTSYFRVIHVYIYTATFQKIQYSTREKHEKFKYATQYICYKFFCFL